MARDKQLDLMKALVSDRRAAADSRSRKSGVDIVVRDRLVVDLGAAESEGPYQMLAHVAAVIKGELQASSRSVSQATRDRRRRAQRTPQQGRYPAGYSPNPSGPFAFDSGYTADSLKPQIEGNAVTLRVPKNREKAMYPMRVVSPASKLEGDGAKKAMNKGLDDLLKASIKKVRGR